MVTESTDFTDLTNKEAWLSSTKLVVKPDILFGKRGKSGLVALNLDLAQVARFVKERLGVEQYPEYKLPNPKSWKDLIPVKVSGLSTKELEATGSKYESGLEEMYDGAIKSCKEKGFL
ncbi:ATP-citrate synthase alpha chain protein [Castilleja foliolosa]|uniref:ATP-citrate synthase alpha chain protein n=1 Tax=Castilleja foliolosa TaxID=1961234 RepID=A0ABD3E7U2_9LAMI